MNTLDKVYDLTIDIKNIDVKYNSYAKFFDDDRETSVIRIKLLNDKTPINLENCIVEAYFILADNTYHNEACKIINSSEGVVELQLCQKCLVKGENIVRLSILKDNEISNTPVVTYEVRKGLYSDNPSFNDDPLTPILSQMLLDIKVTKVNQIELQERYEKSLPKIEGKIKEVESLINRVDTAIASGTQDLEVKEARVDKNGKSYAKLGDRLNEVDSQLEHIENFFIYYIDKYENLLTNDDWGIVLTNLISTIDSGATIIFGAGTYNIKTTTVTNKKIRLVGQGALGTIINCTNNSSLIKFLGGKAEYNSLGGCGCSNMTINGEQVSSNPAIHYVYTAIGHNENLVINNFGGGAFTFESSQDISLFKVYTRRCGNKDNDIASINLLKAEEATNNQNCNEITFTECTFEHNTGRLVKSDFEHNNSISFNDCKFEYNNEGEENLNEPIYIKGGDRLSFNECRYTHYPTNGMFKLYNVTNSRITGKSFNSKNVTKFADIDNCINLEIDVIGRKTGKANITGSSYYINSKIHDRELLNYILTKEVQANTIVNMNNFYYKDEGAIINNFEISGSGANKKIINILVSDNDFRSGITIYVHAKNSVARQVKFGIRDSEKREVFTKHIQVNTNYDWIKFSVPFEYCRAGEFSFYMANTIDDVILSVDGIYYENRVISQNEVPTFTGIKGDIVWNTFPTTGDPIGWVCNSTGVNWKGFGTVL